MRNCPGLCIGGGRADPATSATPATPAIPASGASIEMAEARFLPGPSA